MPIDDDIIQTPDGPMTWAEWKRKNSRPDPLAPHQGEEAAGKGKALHVRSLGSARQGDTFAGHPGYPVTPVNPPLRPQKKGAR